MAHTGHGGNDGRLFADATALGDYSLQFLQTLLHMLKIGEKVIHLQAIDLGQNDLL
jgi:hypothetical protein